MKKITFGDSIKYIILVIFSFTSLFPVFLVWISSFKSTREIYSGPFTLPSSFNFVNFVDAWNVGHFGIYFINSFIVTIPTVIIVIALSCLAGFAFAKISFFGSRVFFIIFLLGLMVPFSSFMIPLYYITRDLRLLGTYFAMILPSSALGLPFGIFLMHSFFRSLPSEIMDAARIDGCSEFGTFLRVMMPLAGPAVFVLFIFQFMWTWNNFIMPLILLNQENLRPISLGLMFYQARFTTNPALISAGVTIASLPVVIVFIIFQRHFIHGLTAGSVKG